MSDTFPWLGPRLADDDRGTRWLMAIVVPDSCPSRATVGEKRVYAMLRDLLPDNFTVWYEAFVAARHPDFTVLAEDFGLLILEVKGWYAGQIARATDHEVELHRTEGGRTQVEIQRNPIRQVREYVLSVLDVLARPEFAILRQPEGDHRGRPCFPWGFGVILTNITRAQLVAAGMETLFPPEKVICRDELAALEGAGDRAVIRRLKALFSAPFPFEPLTDDQINTIKGVLHQEVVVRRRPATTHSLPEATRLLPGAEVLDVLDAHQEQVARSLSEGHHLVFGVAGSGKTVLLLARARLLALRDPSSRVLVLCFNKALAADLARRIGDPGPKNVEVRHFHSWAARTTGLRLREAEAFEDYERRVIAAMLGGAGHWTEANRYDAILIDEAHDFAADWFRCVVTMLRRGPEGDLLIAADGAQSLYGRDRTFTWKSVGVQAVGRSRRLTRNYRNTKQILEFAWQVAQSMIPGDESTETLVRLVPTHISRRGPVPRYRGCATIAEEHALIARQVAAFRAQGIAPSDIAVLYPRNDRGRIDGLCALLRREGAVSWFSNESDPGGGLRSLARPGVRLGTVHAAKGLEFTAVIFAALDLLPNPQQADEVRDGNLLYVGLTRAMDELVVTWAGRSAFTDRLVHASKATQLPE